jgi:DNA-binding transcriptional ArsR family regulator
VPETDLICLHEAGHAAAAYLLGREIVNISATPNAVRDGLLEHEVPAAARLGIPADEPVAPCSLHWERLRRMLEENVVIALAGDCAVRAAIARRGSPFPAGELDEISREAARLDHAKAARYAAAVAGHEGAPELLAELERVAEDLAGEPAFNVLLDHIAGELFARRELDGRALTAHLERVLREAGLTKDRVRGGRR